MAPTQCGCQMRVDLNLVVIYAEVLLGMIICDGDKCVQEKKIYFPFKWGVWGGGAKKET